MGIKQAVVDGVFNPYRYRHTYSNSVLWTMQAELFGSLGIYLLYRLVDRRYVPWVLVALFVLLIPQGPLLVRFLGFVGGALIYEALVNGAFSPNKVLFGFTSLFLGFLLGGLPSQPATGTNFGPLEEFVGSFSSPFEFILGMAALFTVMGVVNWGGALKALEFRWFRFLGRISFGVYLTHWPILATLILFIYLNIGYSAAGFLILSVGYFSLVIVAAYLFTVAVDEPTIHLLRWAKTNPVWVLGYFMHAVIVPLALGFVVSRLGYDVGALLVWSIAYTGLCITLPRALLNHPRMKSSINLFGRMAAGFVMNSRK